MYFEGQIELFVTIKSMQLGFLTLITFEIVNNNLYTEFEKEV